MNSHTLALSVLLALPLAVQASDDGPAQPFDKLVPGLQACTTFAPDGKTVYFITVRGEKKITTIMRAFLRDGHWTGAEIAPFSGQFSDGDPAMAPDGSRLFFWSRRPAVGKPTEGWWPDLWYVQRAGDSWSEPRRVSGTLRTGGPAVAADGTLYFFRVTDDKGARTRLVRARPADGYGTKEDLPETVNATYGAFDPAIAPDQSFIILSSKRPDSIGESDLYISYRQKDGWSEPRNLGPKVNSKSGEFCPALSPDGKYLYFTRGDEGVFYVPLLHLNDSPQ